MNPEHATRENLVKTLFPSALSFLHLSASTQFTVPVLNLDLEHAARELGVESIKLSAEAEVSAQGVNAGMVKLDIVF